MLCASTEGRYISTYQALYIIQLYVQCMYKKIQLIMTIIMIADGSIYDEDGEREIGMKEGRRGSDGLMGV